MARGVALLGTPARTLDVVQPDRLKLPLLDPQVARALGIPLLAVTKSPLDVEVAIYSRVALWPRSCRCRAHSKLSMSVDVYAHVIPVKEVPKERLVAALVRHG